MKKNNSYIDDEIDLSEIIKKIWNEKILILSISFIFTVAGFVYGVLQPKIYRTEIIFREPPSYLFEAYRPFFSTQQIAYLNKLLNETKNLTLDYNPILEQASSPALITKSPIIYAAIALLLGLFFSLMIVLIRSIMHK